MNAEIICVGTELLLGDIVNTNAQYLSKKLAELGISVYAQSVVGDNAGRLKSCIAESLGRADIVILTGGLGPTPDDLTKETVAEIFGLELYLHEESLLNIRNYFAKIGRTMGENNRKQALIPVGAAVMPNHNGTAPGCIIKEGEKIVMMFPGPPAELVPMFEESAEPFLRKLQGGTIKSVTLDIFGIGESTVAERLGDMLNSKNPTVATYAKTGEVQVRVTARADSAYEAAELLTPPVKAVNSMFGENVYGIDEDSIQARVVSLLKAQGKKLATAESCTAGILSGMITEIPGASSVFDMGVTAYSDYIKTHALGVSEATLSRHGAVSADVAVEMASSVKSLTGSDLGLGITGVAGPDGSESKPVGLVYVALSDGTRNFVRRLQLSGNREKIRLVSAKSALDLARRYLEDRPLFMSEGTAAGEGLNVMGDYTLPAAAAAASAAGLAGDAMSGNDEYVDLSSSFDSSARPSDYDLDDTNDTTGPSEEMVDFADVLNEPEDISSKPVKKKKGFFKSLLPWKGDSTGEKIRKVIFLLAFVTLIVTLCIIGGYFINGMIQQKMIDDAGAVWDDPDAYNKNADGIFIGFESLIKQNSDIKAWIRVPNTKIDNPVYQTTNNDFYVNHNMNKQPSSYGAVFLDKDAVISKEGNSQNLVLYGHHMNDGAMFGTLKKYRSLDFYKENPLIDFTTLYERGQYKVFSVFITNAYPEGDNGNVFQYRYHSFGSDAAFLNFTEQLKIRSIIDTGVDIMPGDELLTLSTCIYDFEDARLVVVARRVRDGETNAMDTSKAKYNPSPLYPAAYYEKKGGSKPNISISSLPAPSGSTSSAAASSSGTASAASPSNNTSSSSQNTSTNTTSTAPPVISTPPPSTSSAGGSSVASAAPSSSSEAAPPSSEQPAGPTDPVTSDQPAAEGGG